MESIVLNSNMNDVSSYDTIDKQWSAVISRDRNAATAFVFSVTTTGIFCRPNCGARQARKANVNFFTDANAAMQAGYRACKRCRPELESWDPVNDVIEKACGIIRAQVARGTKPKLADLAKQCGMTKYHFHRTFKKLKGQTPKEFATVCQGETHEVQSMHIEQAADFVQPLQPAPPKAQLTANSGLDSWTDFELAALPNDDNGFPQQTDLLHDEVDTGCVRGGLAALGINQPGLSLLDDYYDYPSVFPLPDTNDLNMDQFDHQNLVIQYTITSISIGKLLIAFQYGHLCALRIGTTDSELLSELYNRFHSMSLQEINFANAEIDLRTRHTIAVIIEAIEEPSGEDIDLSLNVDILV